MGYWKWFWNTVKEQTKNLKYNLTKPLTEYSCGSFIALIGCLFLIVLIIDYNIVNILRGLLLIILGCLLASHGWYREWASNSN